MTDNDTNETNDNIIDITQDSNDTEFKLRGQSYLDICVDDALYNPPYEVMIQYSKGSEFAGWGLERPESRLVSYQRLWEYYVNMETYRSALYYEQLLLGGRNDQTETESSSETE